MINISLDLSNKVPAEQVNIIRQVVHAAESQGLRQLLKDLSLAPTWMHPFFRGLAGSGS